MAGHEDTQRTEVHYQSLNATGQFNWRFVFSFEYLPQEELCVVSKIVNAGNIAVPVYRMERLEDLMCGGHFLLLRSDSRLFRRSVLPVFLRWFIGYGNVITANRFHYLYLIISGTFV